METGVDFKVVDVKNDKYAPICISGRELIVLIVCLTPLSTVLQLYRTYPCFPGVLLTHYQTTNFRLFQTEKVCRRQLQI